MDNEIYKAAIEYEILTQAVYKAILAKEGTGTINVHHNVSIAGRSGVEHQVDVYWEFKQAGVTHKVLIECKNYSSNLTLEKARNFFAVLHDVGNCNGIMVTKTGYQSGVTDFCKFYGIALKVLRKPTDGDWEGRIKEIHINLRPRVPVSNEEHSIICNMYLRPSNTEQEARLNQSVQSTPEIGQPTPSMRFLNADGEPITDEMRWWIPKQLNVLEQEDGGPYIKSVELENHYIVADLGEGEELVQVIGVVLEYYVETLEAEELVIDATATVDAILKDFESGEWEHVRRGS